MSIKLSEFQVDPEDIFANDKLGRKDEVKNIAGLLVNIPTPLTFAISSAWGTGKTSFSKMLKAHLTSQGRHAIYFNAWATDFADDPLTAFLGEINEQLSSYIERDKSRSEAWIKAKQTGAYLVRKVLPVALNIGTAGILNIDGRIEDKLSELTSDFTEDAISAYTKDKKQIQLFRKHITDLVSDETASSIYIFIDELDRCRPLYAVELLERIKHLFNIPGITFILAMDKDQLAHSICGLYGGNFDGAGYLKRFIDIEYQLNAVEISVYAEFLFEFMGFTTIFENRAKCSPSFNNEKNDIISVVKLLARARNLSLRDLEQYLARLKIMYYAVEEGCHIYPYITAFILYLKMYKPDALRDRTPKEYRQSLKRELLIIAEQADEKQSRIVSNIESYIAILLFGDEWEPDENYIAEYRKLEAGQTIGSPEQKEYARNVAFSVERLIERCPRGIKYDYIYSKAALVEQLKFGID